MAEQTEEALAKIAKEIGGTVWDSGGGNIGVLVQIRTNRTPWISTSALGVEWEVFFGFADGTLGWDIDDVLDPFGRGAGAGWVGGGITHLTIDQIPEVIERCRVIIQTKEIQFT